jgi:hypothetical protein
MICTRSQKVKQCRGCSSSAALSQARRRTHYLPARCCLDLLCINVV